MNKNITNETLKKYARMGAKAFMTNPGYVLSCKDENKKEDFIYNVILTNFHIVLARRHSILIIFFILVKRIILVNILCIRHCRC